MLEKDKKVLFKTMFNEVKENIFTMNAKIRYISR